MKLPFTKAKRTYWICDDLSQQSGTAREIDRYETAEEKNANLISSRTQRDTHMPCIDIDEIPVKVLESSTPGNYHLYIDKEMTWEQYDAILSALTAAGVVEAGYYKASVQRRMTFLRRPNVKKTKTEERKPGVAASYVRGDIT